VVAGGASDSGEVASVRINVPLWHLGGNFDFRLVELAWDNSNNHTGGSNHEAQELRWRSTRRRHEMRSAMPPS
jgi:hypothetical protein